MSSFLLALLASARAAEELTLEWILSPEAQRAFAVPRVLWLSDETLLIRTAEGAPDDALVERLDPGTGARRPLGDAARIRDAWKALVGEDAAPKSLSLPFAATEGGKTLLYERGGDLFALEPDDAVVRRLTNTEAAETSPRLSPDGRRLAFVRESDLYSVEVATGRERRLTRDGSDSLLNGTLSWVYWEEIFNRRDEGYWWAPDSGAIAYLQTDEAAVSRYPLVGFEPEVPAIRWQRYPKAGGLNPHVRLGIVEGEGGVTRWIDLSQAASPSDREYIGRVVWMPDSSALLAITLNRAQNHLEGLLVPRHEGEVRRIFEEDERTWINLHDDARFLSTGEGLLWLSETEGHRHLYLQPVSGTPRLPITKGEWVLRPGGALEPWIGAVAWVDAPGRTVFVHAATPSPLGLQLYRVGLDGEGWTRLSEGDGVHGASFSPRGAYFVDEHSRAGVPPRLTLHRADGTLVSVLKPSATDRLEPFALTPPRLFEVPARDGVPLQARLYEPKGKDDGARHPAIVYVYGGPGSPAVGDRWEGTWYLWSQLLAQRGYAVFSIDPRSAADRGKKAEDSVHRNFYGEGELADILAGVGHLKSLPYVDPERVGIWGWSGGGTSTVHAMTRSKEFRAGIAVAGVGDQRYYDTIYTERYMGRPAENPEGYSKTASAAGAGDLHGRLLIVHGTGDDNVHAQSALRIANDLIAAGKQFDLMLYPGRGHGIGDPPARKHLFQLMLDFWERELGR